MCVYNTYNNAEIWAKNIKRHEKERQHVVFIESHEMSVIRTHFGLYGSAPCLGPFARLSPGPVFRIALTHHTSKISKTLYFILVPSVQNKSCLQIQSMEVLVSLVASGMKNISQILRITHVSLQIKI
jgi:hypothetical protein